MLNYNDKGFEKLVEKIFDDEQILLDILNKIINEEITEKEILLRFPVIYVKYCVGFKEMIRLKASIG
jgi:hypothetical protein